MTKLGPLRVQASSGNGEEGIQKWRKCKFGREEQRQKREKEGSSQDVRGAKEKKCEEKV